MRAALSIDDVPELRERPHQLGAADARKVAHALMRTRESSTSAATSMASSPKVSRWSSMCRIPAILTSSIPPSATSSILNPLDVRRPELLGWGARYWAPDLGYP